MRIRQVNNGKKYININIQSEFNKLSRKMKKNGINKKIPLYTENS